jgi:hypothetical protein
MDDVEDAENGEFARDNDLHRRGRLSSGRVRFVVSAGVLAVVAGALAVGGYAVASASSSHGSSLAQFAKQALASATTSKPATAPVAPGPPVGASRPGPGFGGFGRGGTVTKLSATTITVDSGFGGAVTVTTNASTSYSESGKKVTRAALVVGDEVLFRPAGFERPVSSAGSATAGSTLVTSVEIVLPEVQGTVVGLHGSQVVIAQRNGLHVTANTSASTTYGEDGQSATAADLKVGSTVSVTGTLSFGKTQIDATVVQIVLPSVTGRVTSVSTATITITSFTGTETITIGSNTTFRDKSGKTTIASVEKGDFLQASGTPGSGSTFAAVTIYVAPSTSSGPGFAGGGPGSFVPGRFGRGGRTGGFHGPGGWPTTNRTSGTGALPGGSPTAF